MFELLRDISNGHDLTGFNRTAAEMARPAIGWGLSSAPAADVFETPDAIRVLLDVPGYTAEQIDVRFENDVLTLEGARTAPVRDGESALVRERRFGKFRRTFAVKVPIDAEKIAADYDAGVLTITLPKRAEARPRKIEIKSAK